MVAINENSGRALAHASSLTLGFERICWVWDRDLLVGPRARLACLKNKLAAPGSVAELEMRYGLAAMLFTAEPVKEVSERLDGDISGAAAMAGPVCCGLIPHLELALHPELYGQPVVVARFGDRVITASQEAAAHGVLSAEWLPAAAVTELAIELPELEAAGRRQLRLWRGGDGSVEEVEAALERLQERYGVEVALRVRSELLASPLPAQRYALVPK